PAESSLGADGRGGYGSSVLFEEMGLRYIGPIDGHDLPLLINVLEYAKTSELPIVLHVLTKKGKGYDVAIQYPEKFHGTGPYDIVHREVCLQDLPVMFCMERAGRSANDGPTHHGLFDIAYLRCLPNLIAMAPKDEDELVDMMFTATHQKHPTFIRYPRGPAEGVPINDMPRLLEIGKAEVVQNFSSLS